MRNLIWLVGILVVVALLLPLWLRRTESTPGPASPALSPSGVPSASASVSPLDPPGHLGPLEQDLWRVHMALMLQDPWPPSYYNLAEAGGHTYVLTVGQAGFGSFKMWAVWEKSDQAWVNRGHVVIGGEEAPSPRPNQYKELGLEGLSSAVQQSLLNRETFRHISPLPDE